MGWFTRTLVFSTLALLSVVLSLQSAAAAVSTDYGVIGPIVDAEVGMVISQELTVGIAPEDEPRTFTARLTTASSSSGETASISILSSANPAVVPLSLALTAGDITECTDRGSLTFTTTVTVEDPNGREPTVIAYSISVDCSVPVPLIEVLPLAPSQSEVCGPDNDIIVTPVQPLGVDVLSDIVWSGGYYTVQFFPLTGYEFPPGTETTHRFTDANTPCSVVPPTVEEVCGPNNDIVTIPEQLPGIIVDADADWVDGSFTVTFSAAPGFTLDPGAIGEFVFVDEGIPCPTETPLPTPTPTGAATEEPTAQPTTEPTVQPTEASQPTVEPTVQPTATAQPTEAAQPTVEPTVQPPTPTVVPPAPTTVTPSAVTGLPNTGTGAAAGPGVIAASLVAMAVAAIAVVGARERYR